MYFNAFFNSTLTILTEAGQKTKNPGIERDQGRAKEADPVNAPDQESDPDRGSAKGPEVEKGPGLAEDRGLIEGRDPGTADADRGAEAATAGETREIRRSGKDRRHRRKSPREVGGLRRQRRRAKRASTRVKSRRKTRSIKSEYCIL